MNGQDFIAAPLVFGSLIPAIVLIIVSFILGTLSKSKFRQLITHDGMTRRGVVRWSVINGFIIFALTFFPLPDDIAILLIALPFSFAAAGITFYAENSASAIFLSIAIIGGILSAGAALSTSMVGMFSQFQQLITVLAVWPVLAGPAMIAAIIAAALSVSAKSNAY
ncbi:transporter [Corynebacterium sp. L4756]|uniref:transporter n=1 Tax=unclassified Corynebacterium TaxID=2624378 RepID=UPI00374DB4CF